jgi:hypothetical protein
MAIVMLLYRAKCFTLTKEELRKEMAYAVAGYGL